MSEDRRRRRIRGRVAGRVGEPNVLSNAAAPNTLSGQAKQPVGVLRGTRESPEGWLSTGTTAPRSGVRLPSFGTLIFLGFLAITGFRLLGEFAEGLVQASPGPSVAAPEPGSILFGAKSRGDCSVDETGLEFEAGTSVWWSAELATLQNPDAAVVVIVRRDGTQVDREDVPPDPEIGSWSVLCSSDPVVASVPGVYRVEVWDASVTTLQAAGEYRLTAT